MDELLNSNQPMTALSFSLWVCQTGALLNMSSGKRHNLFSSVSAVELLHGQEAGSLCWPPLQPS